MTLKESSFPHRLKLTLAYTGSNFCGWQIQPGTRTVQGVLERALSKICDSHIRVHGAGRTDTGVHALGQVAHCDIPAHKVRVNWQRALNSLLPDDLAVTSAENVPGHFHARFSSTGKIYTYTLWTDSNYILPQRRPFVWQTGKLEMDKMLSAARMLQGQHDFSAFQNVGTPVQSSVRNLYSISQEPGFYPQETVWRLAADGFLKQMVRIIMACLVSVGKGKLSSEELLRIKDSKQRELASATAPACGLCLEKVVYNDGI